MLLTSYLTSLSEKKVYRLVHIEYLSQRKRSLKAGLMHILVGAHRIPYNLGLNSQRKSGRAVECTSLENWRG